MNPLIASWPASPLRSNSRAHWRLVAKARQEQRKEGWILARLIPATARTLLATEALESSLRVHADFYPPDRKLRDSSNCGHSIKSLIDGIADGLGVNDRYFKVTADLKDETCKGGCVKIYLGAST